MVDKLYPPIHPGEVLMEDFIEGMDDVAALLEFWSQAGENAARPDDDAGLDALGALPACPWVISPTWSATASGRARVGASASFGERRGAGNVQLFDEHRTWPVSRTSTRPGVAGHGCDEEHQVLVRALWLRGGVGPAR